MKSPSKKPTSAQWPRWVLSPLSLLVLTSVQQLGLPRVRYQYFDFHNECKNMRWDRISVLIEQMEEDLTRHGYVHWILRKRSEINITSAISIWTRGS